MRVLVIRHAEPEPRWDQDPRLSAAGRRQAACLSRALGGEKLDRVVSSAMRRAMETAELLAATLEVPLITEPDLIEIGMGELAPWGPREQAEWELTTERWERGDFTAGPRGGESLIEVINRVEPVVRRLAAEPCEHGIAIVGHAVVNGVILSSLCPELRPTLGRDLGHGYTGVWELEGEGQAFRVARRNDTGHLVLAQGVSETD